MGSRCKKALVAESVRESLHSWCKRVKQKSKRDSLHSQTVRSTCSLESTIEERDEITVASGTLSRTSSLASLNQEAATTTERDEAIVNISNEQENQELSFRVQEYLDESISISMSQSSPFGEGEIVSEEGANVETLFDLFRKT